MSCGPNISIAISLIALTTGVWFLYKTQKENLSVLFKVAAWAIIVGALLNIACCGLRCMKHCGKMKRCVSVQSYGMGGGCGTMNCGMAMGNHCGMAAGWGMQNNGRCGMMAGGGCCTMMEKKSRCAHKRSDCCEETEESNCEVKKEIVKDTVIRRK